MQKPSPRIAPVQYLVVLVILVLAAFFRTLNPGTSPSPAGPTSSSLPQSKVTRSPTRVPTASPAHPSRTPKPQVDPSPTATSIAGKLSQFDFFVLALSWSPDYCATNGSNDPQQCSVGKKLGFVLHGLWPQNNKGYPSNCSAEKMPASVKAQFPGLYPNDALFDHEWEKHGTCTGLSPLEYLQLEKQLKESVAIPGEFRSPEKPFRTSMDNIKTLFGGTNSGFSQATVEVSCSGSGRFLKEIYVCFSREGKPAACSAEMQKTAQKSCQAADFLVRNTR